MVSEKGIIHGREGNGVMEEWLCETVTVAALVKVREVEAWRLREMIRMCSGILELNCELN